MIMFLGRTLAEKSTAPIASGFFSKNRGMKAPEGGRGWQ
jgi:hypothetical protein